MRKQLFTKVQNLYSLTPGPGRFVKKKCPMVGYLDKRDRVLDESTISIWALAGF